MNPDITCEQYAQPFAFLGNSLLDTMRHTGQAGLDPAFWAAFPDVGDESVGAALDALFAWSQDAQARQKDGEDVLTEECVEYTRLFVGPPSPAVAPWETFYRAKRCNEGFGEATFAMRDELRKAGLEVKNENNQYADHMGLELLLLSELCLRGERTAADAFAGERPGSWCKEFAAALDKECPGGYYALLAELICALLG